MMSHNSLANYYQMIFSFKQHHNWNVETVENMMPFEFEIYAVLLKQWLEEENERIRQQNQ